MNEFLIYLLGIIASFILSVIAFRFRHFEFNKYLMPVTIFVWVTSWAGAAIMLALIIIDIIINSSMLYKLYNKLTNGFIKLIGSAEQKGE